MSLETIKEAIEQLPESDRQRLAEWFDDLRESVWDAEMERDFAPGGRGHALLDLVRGEIAAGKATDLESGLAQRRGTR